MPRLFGQINTSAINLCKHESHKYLQNEEDGGGTDQEEGNGGTDEEDAAGHGTCNVRV
jgi:hypothetical protein